MHLLNNIKTQPKPLIERIEHFKIEADKKIICLERALDIIRKHDLRHYLEAISYGHDID